MAKDRKGATKKKPKRVGAMAMTAKSPLVLYGSIAAGFLFGNKINTAIDNAVGTNIDTKLIAGGQLGIGALLALKKGGRPNMIKTVLGGVMLGAGGKRALAAFGLGNIGGYQAVPSVGGYQKVPSVGGASNRRVGNFTTAPGGGINGYRTTRSTIARSVVGAIQ